MSCGGCLGTAKRAIGMAARGALGVGKVAMGVGLATVEVIEQRRAICRGCEIAVECAKSPGRKCWCGNPAMVVMGKGKGCGCSIEIKTRVASEICPEGKWASVMVEGGRSQVV